MFPETDRTRVLGAVAMIVATLFFAFQDAFTKVLIAKYPVWELVFVRFLVLLALTVLVAAATGRLRTFAVSKRPGLQIVRGLAVVLEIMLIGASFRTLDLGTSLAIFHVFPIVGTVLAVIFLRERAGWITIAALAAGFAGLLIAVGPGTDLDALGVLLSLSAAVAYAVYIVLTRFVARGDDALTSMFYISVCGATVPLIALGHTFVPIESVDIWLFVGLCGVNVVAQTSVIVALSLAPATLLQPFSYLQIGWAIAIGFLVFAELPAVATVVGGLIIVAAGLVRFLTMREGAPRR